MLKSLGDRPWRYRRIADQLAELHTRLAGLPTGGLEIPVRFERAECLVHLDLHPGNVILTSRGPVVIDWSNAGMGPRGADVATTWILLTIGEADDIPVCAASVRRRRSAGDCSAASSTASSDPIPEVIRMVAEHRSTDWNLRRSELDKLQAVPRGVRSGAGHRLLTRAPVSACARARLFGLLVVKDREATVGCVAMSKKTKKRKARLRRSKANHGKRPNMG